MTTLKPTEELFGEFHFEFELVTWNWSKGGLNGLRANRLDARERITMKVFLRLYNWLTSGAYTFISAGVMTRRDAGYLDAYIDYACYMEWD